MNRILCSTGALLGRPNGRDFTLLKSCFERLDCSGFELLMYDTWYDRSDELRQFMAELSAPVPVFHIEKQVGELISRNIPGDTEKALELFEMNCALAKDIGSDMLVLHLWNGLDSDRDMPHNIECFRHLRGIAEKYGLLLTVENVVCNHADPMTHMKTLAELFPDIGFTFDTKMAAFHSQLEQLYAEENKPLFKHIRHLHINDYGGGHMDWANLRTLHIGDGHIDFGRFFDFIIDMGYSGDITVEATSFDKSGTIDIEALNNDFRRIREYLAPMS